MDKHPHIHAIQQLVDRYKEAGLTIFFDDGQVVDLTYRAVNAAAERLEHDQDAIPADRRSAAEFLPCKVCPARHTAAMCHALPAILPFLDELNPHKSYKHVYALYVEKGDEQNSPVLHASSTSLQRALHFVAMQSVLSFCEIGRLYRRFFSGVIPFSSSETIAERIYANVMLDNNGRLEEVEKTLQSMRADLTVTMQCQIKRVYLVTRSDAFANAFVNLHLALQLLAPDSLGHLREVFSKRLAQDTP